MMNCYDNDMLVTIIAILTMMGGDEVEVKVKTKYIHVSGLHISKHVFMKISMTISACLYTCLN